MQEYLEKAIQIALDAHRGKIDKGGSPYILHPLRIMLSMETIDEQIVGILHDVIEDSIVTIDDLRTENFSENILEALELLTKKVHQSYEEYIFDIKYNQLAKKVKIADLEDNMNIKRLNILTGKDIERIKKYRNAFKLLKD